MITFFTACGTYRITSDERGQNAPYIQTMGKLHAISIPEFVIWTNLLWDIHTYEDLKENYTRQLSKYQSPIPDFDELLEMLLARKLVVRGVGYTGEDALYHMLSDAFVLPHNQVGSRRRLPFPLLRTLLGARHVGTELSSEQRILSLVRQTPLSVAELTRCFDLNLHDVGTPDKLIAGLYLTSDQAHISAEQQNSPNKRLVLQAVANLYLHRKVYLEST